MAVIPFYKQRKFWKLIVYATIIGLIMFISAKFKLDWRVIWDGLF